MSIAADLRAMREYIDAHGFSAEWSFTAYSFGFDVTAIDCPQCFVGSLAACLGDSVVHGAAHPTIRFLMQFTGSVDAAPLERGGWYRDDALAVLEIAEACAIEEGV